MVPMQSVGTFVFYIGILICLNIYFNNDSYDTLNIFQFILNEMFSVDDSGSPTPPRTALPPGASTQPPATGPTQPVVTTRTIPPGDLSTPRSTINLLPPATESLKGEEAY